MLHAILPKPLGGITRAANATDTQRPQRKALVAELLKFTIFWDESRNSSVGLATRLLVGKQGFDSWEGQQVSFYSTVLRSVLGPAQLSIQRVRGGCFLGIKADHSRPSSAEMKNGGTIPPPPPFAFRVQRCLINEAQRKLRLFITDQVA
jgi:hypothetical protein